MPWWTWLGCGVAESSLSGSVDALAPPPPAPPAAVPAAPAPAATPSPVTLFDHGLGCEISAAVTLADGRVVLADNEVDDQLVVLRVGEGGLLDPGAATAIVFPKDADVGDIEALALLGDGRMVAVGSQGRKSPKKSCGAAAKRMKRATLVQRDGTWVHEATGPLIPASGDDPRGRLASKELCLTLFPTPPPGGADEFCEAVAASDAPRPGADGAVSCDGALQFEGAAVVDGALWLGARGPSSEAAAWLLQVDLANAEHPFAAVERLPAGGGRGVRELTTHGGALYAVVGPVPDGGDGFEIVRYRREEGAFVRERGWPAPKGTEALVVRAGGEALVAWTGQDGHKPDGTASGWGSGDACVSASTQQVVPLPEPPPSTGTHG